MSMKVKQDHTHYYKRYVSRSVTTKNVRLDRCRLLSQIGNL